MTGRSRLDGPGDDRGAALVLVLVIVTVIGLVGAALLSLSDASIRTTVALRDQAAQQYAADGAAKVAISELENGKLDCPSATPTTKALGIGTTTPFYTPTQSESGPLNATIECAANPIQDVTTVTTTTGSGTVINASNTPPYALLTVGTTTHEDGQKYTGNAVVCIGGGSVFSNSTIKLGTQKNNILAVGLGTASTDCPGTTDKNVTIQTVDANGCNGHPDGNSGDFSVTLCKHSDGPIDFETWKNFALAPAAPATQPPSNQHAVCTDDHAYAAFEPGYYSDVSLLNSPCFGVDNRGNPKRFTAGFQWFSPGIYYFDFGSDPWSWPTTLVGGTPLDSSSGNALTTVKAREKGTLDALSKVTSFPGSCADPSKQSTYPGVEFVFGGASTVEPNSSGKNEICATYSATSPPVAIYGVSQELMPQSPVNLGTAGAFAVLSKSGITDVPPSPITGNVGASPITGAAVHLTCPEVTGTIYTVNAAGPLPCRVTDATRLTAAVGDMETAYNDAAGRTTPDFVNLGAGEIGGLTLTPGLYKWGTGVTISNDVTLAGGPNDVWIFQIAGTLTEASAKRVTLTGGAQAKNVFWQIAGAVTIGTTAHFEGTILAKTMIAMNTGASAYGRLLAQTAVTLQMNAVTWPGDAVIPLVVVTAQTLCDEYRYGVPCTSASSGGHPLIQAGKNDSFFIQGFTYAPSAQISLTQYKGSAGQVFGWGLLARSVAVTVNGSISSAPFIVVLPAATTGGVTTTTTTPTIRYISVWTCPASATACPQTNAANVTVKVQTQANGTVKVLSWSTQR